jgi:hypothetical protein
MQRTTIWKVRAIDLRRMAASSVEPERQRKMLVLADQLEEQDADPEPRAEAQEDPSGR